MYLCSLFKITQILLDLPEFAQISLPSNIVTALRSCCLSYTLRHQNWYPLWCFLLGALFLDKSWGSSEEAVSCSIHFKRPLISFDHLQIFWRVRGVWLKRVILLMVRFLWEMRNGYIYLLLLTYQGRLVYFDMSAAMNMQRWLVWDLNAHVIVIITDFSLLFWWPKLFYAYATNLCL
jgi:hypothetical protein